MDLIYKKENEIFEKIKNELSQDEREKFVRDGLCWADICCGEELPDDVFTENENLYLQQRPRIVFLLKESNDNAGEDYRDWHWAERKGCMTFKNSIALWYEGLLSTTATYLSTLKDLRQEREIFTEHPCVIVNIKKTSGGNKSSWNEILQFATEHAQLLRKQLNLYKPDIIVCCGSTDNEQNGQRMLNIAKKYLYSESNFDKINDFCHYCSEVELLLIDSYHPSYHYCDEWKFDKMFECYHKFLQKHPLFLN